MLEDLERIILRPIIDKHKESLMVDLSKFENAGQVNKYVDGLEAESNKLRAEIEKLSVGILRLIKEPRPEINGSAVDSALALIASMVLQVDALKKALGASIGACPTCGNGGRCRDHPRDMHDLLCADKQVHPRPKYTYDDYAPKKGDRYQTQSYIREWDGEQWITLPVPAQGLAPSGSCPCRMDGEVLVACERHAIR
jgi:hypothetical protein